MSNQLTAEQQRRIEENRRRALERRAQRLGQSPSTATQFQPPKHGLNSDPNTLARHRETQSSVPPPKRFVPPFKKDSPASYHPNQGAKQQHLSGAGSPINQSGLSKQVRSGLKD